MAYTVEHALASTLRQQAERLAHLAHQIETGRVSVVRASETLQDHAPVIRITVKALATLAIDMEPASQATGA